LIQLIKTYWIGTQFDLSEFKPISNWINTGLNKPKGGIWTSPHHEWKIWCIQEEFMDVSIEWELIIDSSNLIIVDSKETTLKLPIIPYRTRSSIDFELLTKKYTGLWIKPFKNWRFMEKSLFEIYHFDSTLDWYAWDCESILIFDPLIIKSFKQVEKND
jgi:hypothetical protein